MLCMRDVPFAEVCYSVDGLSNSVSLSGEHAVCVSRRSNRRHAMRKRHTEASARTIRYSILMVHVQVHNVKPLLASSFRSALKA